MILKGGSLYEPRTTVRARARHLAVALICCAFVVACTGSTEPSPDVVTKPVYRINGASAAPTEMRQEVPQVQTIRMGEEIVPPR
jgi:hypothetical protein